MIHLIAIFFLSRYIGNLARRKGHTVWKWRLAMVLAWFALALPIILISFGYSGSMLTASISGFIGGLLSFFILKNQVDKLKDESQKE